MFCRLCTRAVPAEYGPRTTLFNCFNRWSECGLWQQLFATLAAYGDLPVVAMVDGTAVRAHRSAAGARGGSTARIHVLADQAGWLYALLPTLGQAHDIHGARHRLASVAAPASLIGDKAYDANDLRRVLAAQGTCVVISPMPTRTNRPAFDPIAYRQCNIIERAFCRLKDWRAIATRYGKTARNVLAGISLAAAITW